MGRLRFFAAAALLVLVAAACGDDTPTTPRAGGTTPLNDHGKKDVSSLSDFTLEIDDNYFQPTFLKVKAGQKLSLELENQGASQHTFTITSLNIDQVVDPSAKKEIEITFSDSGADIAFFCRIHGAAVMRGGFYFGSAPASGGGGTTTPGDSDSY
jgi:plastocyanin